MKISHRTWPSPMRPAFMDCFFKTVDSQHRWWHRDEVMNVTALNFRISKEEQECGKKEGHRDARGTCLENEIAFTIQDLKEKGLIIRKKKFANYYASINSGFVSEDLYMDPDKRVIERLIKEAESVPFPTKWTEKTRDEYERNPLVRKAVVARAGAFDEYTNQMFDEGENGYIVNVHHIKPLGQSGPDTIFNCMGLRGDTHDLFHYGLLHVREEMTAIALKRAPERVLGRNYEEM